jgi:ketosteroid isomerase-like protein
MSRGKRQSSPSEGPDALLSRENVKLARRSMEAWNSGNVEAWLETLDPAVRMWPPEPDHGQPPYKGHAGAREFREALAGQWGHIWLRSESFHSNGDKVLAVGQLEAHGKENGLRLTTPAAWLVRLRDRRIVAWRVFTDQNEALKAAGLRR